MQKILERHRGSQNPITGKEIAECLGARDTREIRNKILELTHDGLPVASSVTKPFGYYVCETVAEMDSYSSVLKSYMREIAIHRWRFINASYRDRTGSIQKQLF